MTVMKECLVAMLPDMRTMNAASLRAFLAERLAGFEVPRYIVRSAEPLPRTPSGKILKRRIRDAALGRGAG
jgi:long-chain acyl-CoA synthetase